MSSPRFGGDRFLPPDPRVEQPYRFTPQLAIRIAVVGVIAVALFAVLFFRLWALQVISGDRYLRDARDNQIRTFRIQAPRGPIIDRNGRVLVSNVPGKVVELWPAYVPEGQLDGIVRRLSVLLDVPEREIRQGIKARRNDPLTAVIVKTSVHEAKAEYLQEHHLEFPGVHVGATQLRHFDYGSLAAQLLGYVGEIAPEELERLGAGYAGGDRIGKTGIEATYDRYLRGEPGVGQARVNVLGDLRSNLVPSRQPRAGYAVRLTIDVELQAAAERALRDGIALAHEQDHWYANGGAIVALDPRNGEILALASNPTYDPSLYVGRVDPDRLALLAEPSANLPTMNRAIDGLYPPGSTFKPVTALAALQAGILTPDEPISCTPQFKIDKQVFKNWDPYTNEAMLLWAAIARSCDTYFYEVGKRFYELPAERGNPLQDWARTMGFGEKTGIDLGPENEGLLPTPAWRKRHFQTEVDRLWSSGHSVQLAIGQGDLLVTPLQMARFYALVANGGKLVEPHVVGDIEQPGGSEGERPVVLRSFAAKPARDVGLEESYVKTIQDALYQATHDPNYGTSYGVFGNYPISIAGKTGTAEKYVEIGDYKDLQDQSWWCGYGPTDSPELVVCALIENGGHGGDVAAPVALEVFEQFFHQPAPELGAVFSD